MSKHRKSLILLKKLVFISNFTWISRKPRSKNGDETRQLNSSDYYAYVSFLKPHIQNVQDAVNKTLRFGVIECQECF